MCRCRPSEVAIAATAGANARVLRLAFQFRYASRVVAIEGIFLRRATFEVGRQRGALADHSYQADVAPAHLICCSEVGGTAQGFEFPGNETSRAMMIAG